jgi:tetratricopeptide (TPR) repeat protein
MNEATILFLAANPLASGRLELDEEARDIEARIQPRSCKIPLSLRTRWAVRPDDLLLALNQDRPVVVHFSGHGGGAPGLVFHDDGGREALVSGKSLQGLFRALKDDIRIVVLNACYSEDQAGPICEVIDCVIGMSRSIGDGPARVFAAAFYRALAHGRDAQNAFDQGLIAMDLAGLGQEDVPRLLVRTGVTASTIVLSLPGQRVKSSGHSKFTIRLQGSVEDLNDELLAKITDLLREHCSDMTLVIETIREGSVRLTVATTEAGRARLFAMVERGELVELADLPVISIEAEDPADSHAPIPGLLFRGVGQVNEPVTSKRDRHVGRAAFAWLRGDGPVGGRATVRRWATTGLRVILSATAVATVLALKFVTCDQEVECLTAARDIGNSQLVAICAAEYERSRDPVIGLEYAKVLHRSGNRAAAHAIATALLTTPVRADAFLLLGRIATLEGRYEDARSALERALELHRAENRLSGVAEDEQALADVLADQHDYTGALRVLDRCIADAHRSGERRIEGYCHLSAARTLGDVGFFQGAHRELASAEPLLESDRDLAMLYVEQGNLAQDLGQNALALHAFEAALPKAQRSESARLVRSIHENLAYSEAELGRPDAAQRHLREARALDPTDEHLAVWLELEGKIAHHRGDPRAAALLEQAYAAAEDDDDKRVHIAVLRARIALAAGNLDSARTWAERGIENVERIRHPEFAAELRSWMLSSRREPYELLFIALARLGRTEDALLVFDQWYGRTLLAAFSRPTESGGPVDLKDAVFQTYELREVLPSLSSALVMKNDERQVVLDSIRSVDLLALISADDEIWRVAAVAGRVELTSLGRQDRMIPLLDRFTANPTDREVADRLGALILPNDLVRQTDEALRVILDAPLASLPVVALRRGGRPLIATRPVIRSPRLSALSCTKALAEPKRALVLADARGDLPAARREALRVARMFGATALVGDAATSRALLTTQPIDLLHIATHADSQPAGDVLILRDRSVTALELWKQGPAAARVILSACGSATTLDGGATTLVTAFLARGARQVVATSRPVSDAGAEELTRLFYQSGGAAYPVRALANAQGALAETSNLDWPSFAIFGQDTCRTTP